MPQDDTWFPPSPTKPLPVQAYDAPRSGTGDNTWYPPSPLNPLPVTIIGSTPMFPEPPDNQLYGRRGPSGSGAWSLIAATTGPPEAPTDGAIYGRGHVGTAQAWAAVVPLTGAVMTGVLTLNGDPPTGQPNAAATKNYVDNVGATANNAVRRAGDTMTGILTLYVDPPTGQPMAAATKGYVDNVGTVANAAVRRAGDTMTGLLLLSADPTAVLGAVTKQYADAIGTTASAAVRRAGDTMTGPLVLSADPTAVLGAVTKQYADAISTVANAAVRRSGDTMTGLLLLSADPTAVLGAVTKQYADAIMAVAQSGVDIAGDTMTGPLILSGDPTVALGAATRQFVTNGYLPLVGGTIAGTPGSLVIGTPPAGSLGVGTLNMSGLLRVNLNTAVPNTPPANTILHLTHQNTIGPRVVLDGYGAQGNLTIRRANGTAASPTGLIAQDPIGQFVFIGYGATSYSVGFRAAIQGRAIETWDDTHQGTYLNFLITPAGTTANVTAMTLGPGLQLGSPPPPDGDLGSGSIDMSGPLQVNFNAVAAIPNTNTPLHLNGADNLPTRLTIDQNGANGNPAVIFRRNYGTGAAPAPPVAGQSLGTLNFLGWVTGGFTQVAAAINGNTSENWSPTNNGTQIVFQTTPAGQTFAGIATRVAIGQGLIVGAPPDGDLGPGTYNGSGLLDVNMNTVGAPPLATGTGIRLVGIDSTSPRYVVDAFAGAGQFRFHRTDGSNASPSGVVNGDSLGVVAWFGYVPGTPGSLSASRVMVGGVAAETYGATNQGTNLQFSTTPLGATAPTVGTMLLDGAGNLTILGATATKPGGGSWALPSSLAVKKNIESYTRGLDELRQLQPISFEYNGEGGTVVDGKRYVSLAAEAVGPLMPELVSEDVIRRYHARDPDGGELEVAEHRTILLDPSALTYTLINGVCELDRRLAELEAAVRVLSSSGERLNGT
jgi:hypothetical protein